MNGMKKMAMLAWIVMFPLLLQAQDKKITIQGKVKSLSDAATVTLSYTRHDQNKVDTSSVKNGVFVLHGTLEAPMMGIITVYPSGIEFVPSGTGVSGNYSRFLWLEPGEMKIESDESLIDATISGSILNREQAEYDKAMSSIDADTDEGRKYIHEFITSHPGSFVSLSILLHGYGHSARNQSGIPEVSIVEPLFNTLTPAVKNSPQGKFYQAKLVTWKKSGIGKQAPDFTQPDPMGKPVKLSDFKGKYVLLDFWASWCHPCRDENPNLRKQYGLYKDKGFVILALSLDGGTMSESREKARQAWLRAIEKDSVAQFVHVCDLVGHARNKTRTVYGVESIPENFLIDPDGKIIAKGLRGELLNTTLKEVFKETKDNANAPDLTTASAFDGNKKLTFDTAVRTGTLPNGFTYFIRKNQEPKKRVTFYLANKVGSILENDDQQGLAHFLEHMNFNGTTHFPKNDMIDYLQKSGVRFGADLNAYTSFNETVYQLPIPSDDPAILQNGIRIMRDWANGALLDAKEIDKERGVILEEMRIGMGAGERMRRQYLPVIANHSRYAGRIPIGTDEVLKKFKPKTLQSFYTDWYRPNLQALIVVGDIDVDQIEKEIKEKFADLKNPVNEKPRQKYTVPLTGMNQFISIVDKEQTTTSVEILMKHRERLIETHSDFGHYIVRQLFNKMLGARMGELSSKTVDPPYEGGGAGISSVFGGIDCYAARCVVKPGQLERGFKAIWRETERIKRFGFTASELARAKNAILSSTQSSVDELDKTGSSYYVDEYLQYFLNEIPSIGLAQELEINKAFLPTVTPNSFETIIEEYINDIDRDIILIAPEKDRASIPDEQRINQWMKEVEEETIQPYVDTFSETSFLSKEPVPGKIVNEKELEAIQAKEWTLSNGARVIIKKTDFSNNSFLFRATAPGGSSLYSTDDYLSAYNAAFILDQSGLGKYDFSDLNKFISGKDLFIGTGIDDYESSLQGGASNNELETFLKIVYARFTEPRYDKTTFDRVVSSFKSSIENRDKNPESIFQDTVSSVMSNYNERKTPLTQAKLDRLNLDRAFAIYKEIFANAGAFTFYFSGAIDLDKLRPMVEKYIASLPSTGKTVEAKDLGIRPPAGHIKKTVYEGMEAKAKVNLTFSGNYSYRDENNKLMEAVKEILQIKLLERLREKESGAYSPQVYVVYKKIPQQHYFIKIKFDCAPANVEKLIAATLDEVGQLKSKGPDADHIVKFKAEDNSNRKMKLESDFEWLQYMETQVLYQEDLNAINTYSQIMNQVTKENIQKAANQYLNTTNFIELILMPEKK